MRFPEVSLVVGAGLEPRELSIQTVNQRTTQVAVELGRNRRGHNGRLQTSASSEGRSLEVAPANIAGSNIDPIGVPSRIANVPKPDFGAGIHVLILADFAATLRWRPELLSKLCGS